MCWIKPMQAASLGMLARKPDSLCCPCPAWCLSTAEKDWKTEEERKSKVLPVLSSREFGKDKVTKKKPLSIPLHDKPVFQHILPSTVNVDPTGGCCTPGNHAYLFFLALNNIQRNHHHPVLSPWVANLATQQDGKGSFSDISHSYILIGFQDLKPMASLLT